MRWLVCVLLVTACARSAPPARPVPAPVPQDLTAAVHDVLVQHCGECHAGSRATAKPRALAVFDLDRSDWPARFDSRQRFDVALQRLSDSTDADKSLFLAFRASRLR